MAKHSKMQKVVIGTLAAMMVASLVLVVAVLALPTPARAAGELGSRGSWYELRNCTSCNLPIIECNPYWGQGCEYWWCIEYPDGPHCTYVEYIVRCCY